MYYLLLQDTFRGRICECPVANGVQYRGDGYKSCEGVHYDIVFINLRQEVYIFGWMES